MTWIVPAAMAAYSIYNKATADTPSTDPNQLVGQRPNVLTDAQRAQLQAQAAKPVVPGEPTFNAMGYGFPVSQSFLDQDSAKKALAADDANRKTIGQYQIGGDYQTAQNLRSSMVGNAGTATSTMQGLGNNALANSQGAATTIANTGTQAQVAGSQLAAGAGQLAGNTAIRANNAPNSFGNQTTMNQWGASNRGLSQFNAGQTDARLGDSYNALNQYAAQGPGASAAEAQMNAGANQNMAQQVALARSGRGAGANAMAMRQASFNAADIGQRNAQDTATLRAQEAATWRNQQMGALANAGQIAGQIDQSQQNRAGLTLNALQAASNQYGSQYNSQAAATQSAQASAQNWANLAGQQQNQQYSQTMGAYNAQLGAEQSAAAATQNGYNQQQNAYNSAAQQQAGYLNQYYGSYENEADRLNKTTANQLNNGTSMAQANQAYNAQQNANMMNLIGGAAQAYAAS